MRSHPYALPGKIISMTTGKLLNIRTPSGLSGDMILSGLSKIQGLDQQGIAKYIRMLNIRDLPDPEDLIDFKLISVNSISGWTLNLSLPHEKRHRPFGEIQKIIENSLFEPKAKETSLSAFTLLARAEAEVHNISLEDVTFHEVGALDSIIDICISAALFQNLNPAGVICSPLPVADGIINMHHGRTFSPAPAVLKLLSGVPVYGVSEEGETITPTAISLLKAFGTKFGPWPNFVVENSEVIYGSKRFKNLANGAIFSTGTGY